MNSRTVEKLGRELLEAMTHLRQARDLIEGSYRHAKASGGQETGLAKHGSQMVGQIDRLYGRLERYKSQVVRTTQEGVADMQVSKEFKEAVRKELRRQRSQTIEGYGDNIQVSRTDERMIMRWLKSMEKEAKAKNWRFVYSSCMQIMQLIKRSM